MSDKSVEKIKKQAHDEIGKAWGKMRKAGYGDDLNLLAIMKHLQEKFSK